MKKIILSFLFCLIFSRSFAQTQETFYPEQVLSSETLAFAAIPDSRKFCIEMESTKMYQFFSTEMSPFLRSMPPEMSWVINKKLQPFMESILPKLYYPGQISLALVAFSTTKNEQGSESPFPIMLFSWDLDTNKETFAQWFDEFRGSTDEKKEDIHGYTVVFCNIQASSMSILFTYVGNTLLVCNDKAYLESLLANPKKRSDCLADSEQYTKVKSQVLEDKPGLFWYINQKRWMEIMLKQISSMSEVFAQEQKKRMEMMGKLSVEGVGYGIYFRDNKVFERAYEYTPQGRTGLLNVVYPASCDISETRLLQYMPDKLIGFAHGFRNRADFYESATKAIQNIAPSEYEKFEKFQKEMEENIGFNLRNIFLALGNEYLITVSDSGGFIPDLVYQVVLENHAEFQEMANRVFSFIPPQYRHQVEWNGHKFLYFNFSTIHEPLPFAPAVAIEDGRMIITLYPETMKTVLSQNKNDRFAANFANLPKYAHRVYFHSKPFSAALYRTAVPLIQSMLPREKFPLEPALLPAGEIWENALSDFELFITHDAKGVRWEIQSSAGIVPSVLLTIAIASAPSIVEKIGDKVISILAASLKDKNAQTRQEAARMLSGMGTKAAEALPDLIEAIKDQDETVRYCVASALSTIGEKGVSYLIGALQNEDVNIKKAAVVALYNMTDKPVSAIPNLARRLKDADPDIRYHAAGTLKEMREKAISVMPDLIEAFKDQSSQVQSEAAIAVSWMGEKAITALIEALKQRNEHTKIYACVSLSLMDEKAAVAIPELMALFNDQEKSVRDQAAATMTKIGEKAVPTLIEALKHQEKNVRESAAKAMADMGEKAAMAIPALIEAIKDPEIAVRAYAVDALGNMGEKAEPCIPVLIEALQDKETGSNAASALAKIGEKALPALLHSLRHENSSTRYHATLALENMGEKALTAAPVLIECLKDQTTNVRCKAALILTNLDQKPDEAVPVLIEALQNEDRSIRCQAPVALEKMAEKALAAIPALIESLKNEDAELREKAASALGAMGEKAAAAIPALIESLKDQEKAVADKATLALAKMGEKSLPALLESLKQKDSNIRCKVMLVLEQMGGKAIAAVPSLQETTQDQDTTVQETANKSLFQIMNQYLWQAYVEEKMELISDEYLKILEKTAEREHMNTLAAIYAWKKDESNARYFANRAAFFPGVSERVSLLLQGMKPKEVENKLKGQ